LHRNLLLVTAKAFVLVSNGAIVVYKMPTVNENSFWLMGNRKQKVAGLLTFSSDLAGRASPALPAMTFEMAAGIPEACTERR
jgi:hypothetical protein